MVPALREPPLPVDCAVVPARLQGAVLSAVRTRLEARIRPLLAELGKFLVVGGVCFVLDTVLANVFHFGFGLGPTTSKALSTVIAVAASYAGNRLWSFAHRIDQDAPRHGRDATAYLAINAVGLVLTLIPVDVIHYGLHHTGGLAFNLGSVIGTGMATVFRFWAYRRFVFRGDGRAAELEALV